MGHGDWKDMFKGVHENDIELVRYHIRMGVDLNYQHPEFLTSPLMESIRGNHLEIMALLLENGALPDLKEVDSNQEPSELAKRLGNIEAIKLLNQYLPPDKRLDLSSVILHKATMKAVICTKYGAPEEVLQLKQVAKPSPKEDEILVKIVATAVNSGDVRVRGLAVKGFMRIMMQLIMGFKRPRKPILGTVFAGTVEQIGKQVKNFQVGDEVFGMTGFNFGTYAEYIALNQNANVSLKPQNATFEEAAAIVFGGQTAIYFLEKTRIQQRKMPKILLIGATGAVGTAALQIARHFGATITAVCSSRGASVVKRLGVDDIILYDQTDFTQCSQKFDIIFDAVGVSTSKQCRHLLNTGGIYKTVGGLDYASETKAQLALLKKLFENGELQATIDQIFTMEKIVAAHQYVDRGRKKGNVVLKVA
ncbi:MAG: zinc-binding dehydrogenase [Microscillaceae bacterium]|jgi:NADPH:quinone reductase-like Zn-dependent oxidoreductase|nr:zinc-binding dehydrogenase [Microscillaceae bacterium]